jgi:hypothetical protein
MRFASWFLAVVSTVLVACQQSPTANGGGRVVGFIHDIGGRQVINAPSAVTAGQSFNVTVSTFGNSCVSAAGADVAIDGLTARITPYDFVRDDEGCLDIGLYFPRTVQLRFDQPGTATIRVRGRSYHKPEGVTVEHTLIVGSGQGERPPIRSR